MRSFVRPATEADYDEMARFFAMFEMPDPTPPRDWWSKSHGNARFLCERDQAGAERVIGYGLAFWLDQEAHVQHVAVDPSVRGRGVGRQIMQVLAEKLRAERDGETWSLHVKDDNTPAIRLYESVGMRAAHKTKAWHLPWELVFRLPSGPFEAAPVAPEDDRLTEEALGVAHGRLRRNRELGRIIYRASDGSAVVGLASFDPTFPGSPLFVARSLPAARVLLEAFHAHRSAEYDYVRVVTEGDEALGLAFAEAGAEQTASLILMRGPFPKAADQ